MHGRMLLPALFAILLPVAAIPRTRGSLVPHSPLRSRGLHFHSSPEDLRMTEWVQTRSQTSGPYGSTTRTSIA